jgi:predicted GNAT family N-acyltransferase
MHEVVPATEPRDVFDALALRSDVLVHELGLDHSHVFDALDRDSMTVHCVVRDDDGRCVGAGRLVAPGLDASGSEFAPVIGPVVVAAPARGRGIGRAILAFLEEEALEAFGRNGEVRIEARVPRGTEEGAATVGYRVAADARGADRVFSRVFRDVSAGSAADARRGPAVA